MSSRTNNSPPRALIFSIALLGATAVPASAGNITACGQAIDSGTTNGVLTGNLSHTGAGPCLEVKNGKDLNLNGWKIECTNGYSCGPAVECATSDSLNVSSLIYSSNDGDNGHVDITGDFSVGVKNCGTVKNLNIEEASTGILFDHSGTDGQDFFQNVISVPDGGRGIDVKIKDSGDTVSENQITGGTVGVYLREGRTVSAGALVSGNIVRGYSSVGIENSTGDYFRVESNSVMEGDPDSVPFDNVGGNVTYDLNICEDEGDVATGKCECEMDRLRLTDVGACPLL